MSTKADWRHARFSVGDRLFEGEEAVLHVIERIVAPLGLRVGATSPWVDARLPDGSRVQTRFLSALFVGESPRT
jgi:Flp pilus assembly CpaF family ATPase